MGIYSNFMAVLKGDMMIKHKLGILMDFGHLGFETGMGTPNSIYFE